MADTGAPWNLPYPLPTDLVRDGAQAIEDLAEATATGLSAAGSEGIGPNVVQTVKTDIFSTSSLSFVAVTGMSVTITPSSDTAKVLIMVQMTAGSNQDNGLAGWRVTGGNAGAYVGDAAGSRKRVINAIGGSSLSFADHVLNYPFVGIYLDDPQTTSPVTYQVEAVSGVSGRTLFVNSTQALDGDSSASARSASSITAIEVAA